MIKGFLLHQGESNPNDNDWTKKVKGIYDNLCKDLSLVPEKTLAAREPASRMSFPAMGGGRVDPLIHLETSSFLAPGAGTLFPRGIGSSKNESTPACVGSLVAGCSRQTS